MSNDVPVQWLGESPYWVFIGKPECSYLIKSHHEIIVRIATEIYYKWPDRADRRLHIADCTPRTGDCEGHPLGSHGGCHTMDYIYYKLDNGDFDPERNYYFMQRIIDFFPSCVMMVSDGIRNSLMGDSLFNIHVKGDPAYAYNHDKHCHVAMGKQIIETGVYDMPYIAKADSAVSQEYYWKSPSTNAVTFGLERNYPGWIAVDMWANKDGRPTLVKAYEPDTVDEEPVETDTVEPNPVEPGVCKFKNSCPFYSLR